MLQLYRRYYIGVTILEFRTLLMGGWGGGVTSESLSVKLPTALNDSKRSVLHPRSKDKS